MKKLFTFLILIPVLIGCTREDSGGGAEPPVASETANLELLCKVWGMVKYYHPVFTESSSEPDADIDAQLIDLIPQVREAEWEELRQLLLDWIDGLGPFESAKETWDRYFASYVEYGWEQKFITDLEWTSDVSYLGKELSDRLSRLRYALRETPSKYTFRFSGKFDEKAYPEMGDPEPEYRLLCLFRYWNIIEYFFPAKYLTDTPWNDVLREYIPEFLEAQGPVEYKKTVARLIAEICDSHAALDIIPLFGNRVVSGLDLAPVDGKLIVRDTYMAGDIKPGDEVLSVDGATLADVKSKYAEYFSCSNESGLESQASFYLLTTDKSSVQVTYISDGAQKTEILRTVQYRNSPERGKTRFRAGTGPLTNGYTLLMDGEVGYFNPGSYTNPPATEMFRKFKDTKGIIIDMRYYPKNTIWDFPYRHIDNTSRPFVKAIEPDAFLPGSAFISYLTTGSYAEQVSEGTYNGKIVLLVDVNTISQGEFTTMAFQTLSNVTVIGSQSWGADGDVAYLDLPGGISTRYSGLGVQYPDGTETQRHGVRIDKLVRPTVEGLKAGKDELLEEGINIIMN